MNDDAPTLPSVKGRPTKAALDERTDDLDKREAALAAREQAAPRVSIDERVDAHGQRNDKSIRKEMGPARVLDASMYREMYRDKKLMWVNDLNGEVQKWIHHGAEPVPVQTMSSRTFEGITDAHESQWVRAIGGESKSGPFWVYLLMIDPQLFHDLRIAPQKKRQAEIREAMSSARDQSDYSAGPQLPTYAANLPTGGGQGFGEQRETVAPAPKQ